MFRKSGLEKEEDTLQPRGIQQKILILQTITIAFTACALFAFTTGLAPLSAKTATIALFVIIAQALLLTMLQARTLKKDFELISRTIKNLTSTSPQDVEATPKTQEVVEVLSTLDIETQKARHQMENIVGQKRELDAVLESMAEGVIAIDSRERILNMNSAALALLGLSDLPAGKPSIQEVIRNSEFQKIARQILLSHHSIQDDIVFYTDQTEVILQVNAVPLQNSEGESMGALFVFHDITKLRKLESMRSDFVANVSHELKTPITSIKGFVETLLDGAIDSPADARRFIEIVGKQSERLSDIIDDLLSLSRLEQGGDEDQISREPILVRTVIESATLACQHEAREKNISIEVSCDPSLSFNVNSHLVEQALVNLISNGLKYSDDRNRIEISAELVQDEIRLRVQDFGSGISKVHLPRLFERFYRVDKARSRKLGGTGLGLAIVKHIAQAHKGYINVESTVGEGSTFTLHLPQR